MDRRSFLTLLAGASIGQVLEADARAPAKHLVLIELQGGNDGLNTVVPFADKNYRLMRQQLALKTDQLIKLDERFALHPELAPLHGAWQESQLAIVQGLGYENPNRSHFRSHDIWTSASDADERKESGWVADVLGAGTGEVQALVFGNRPALLSGQGTNYISMRRTTSFVHSKLPKLNPLAENANSAQSHVHSVLRDTLAYQAKLAKYQESLVTSGKDDGGSYGDNLFGKQLQDAAALIASGLAPSTMLLHRRGFDTHANQLARQGKLLGELSRALAAFRTELIQSGRWNDTLVVTWSEFGRRPVENASAGTDHGTAAPQFVMGGRVRGGLYGEHPSLTDLQNDDLVHTVDFRQLYSTVASQWWGLHDHNLDVKRYPALDLLKQA